MQKDSDQAGKTLVLQDQDWICVSERFIFYPRNCPDRGWLSTIQQAQEVTLK